MTRTKLKDRVLPNYTRGEEVFNMVTHIVGGGFSVLALVVLVIYSALFKDAWAVVGSAIYGAALIILYTMSSVYHGLRPPLAKKVMQVLDHCTIYFLIAGTYTPILLCAVRKENPLLAWAVFAVEWGLTALAVTLTAIDLKKYRVFSFVSYIGMGWCIIFAAKATIDALSLNGFLWILWGGISYTLGAVFFCVGKRVKYMHSIFHIFVVIGSVLQFFGIIFYAL